MGIVSGSRAKGKGSELWPILDGALAWFEKHAVTTESPHKEAPSTPEGGPTFNELVNGAIQTLHRFKAMPGSATEVDLYETERHLEDALTRYNSARYRMMGTWKRADPDKPNS